MSSLDSLMKYVVSCASLVLRQAIDSEAMGGSLDRSVTLRPYPTFRDNSDLVKAPWSSATQILFLNISSWIGAPMAGCSCGGQKTAFLLSSLLPPWGSQESNSGHQIWWHGAEPSSRSTFFLNCIFCLWGPEIMKLFNSMRSLTCFL